MTDKIGVLTLPTLTDMSMNDNEMMLSGYYQTRSAYDQLRETFRKAVGNCPSAVLLSGHQIGLDITTDSVLTQRCQFDHQKYLNGWYLLMGISYPQKNWANYWPFTVKLLFLGKESILQYGFGCELLEELTNDWNL